MKKILWIGLIGFSIAALSGIVLMRIERSASNVVIDQCGRYVSPKGNATLEVFRHTDDKVQFVVTWKSRDPYEPSGTRTDTVESDEHFRTKSDWLMCWDDKEQLWTYSPEAGIVFYYCDAVSSGLTIVGRRYPGIPVAFLNQLPKHVQ